MPCRTHPSLAAELKMRLENNEPVGDIYSRYRGEVSRNTIRTMRLNIDCWGDIYPSTTLKLGRPRALLPYQEQRVMDLFEDRPNSYLDEAVQFIYDEFDIAVDPATIYRILKRANWSRVACQYRAVERSYELRALWRGRSIGWRAENICFLDESASNERTGDRRYGWSPIGVRCDNKRPIKRSERWSILPALTIEGWIDYIIVQGSITKELFLDFLATKVLPKLQPGTIVVMDNASIHPVPTHA